MAGKKKAHRKKRISKHVIESQRRKEKDDQEITNTTSDNTGNKTPNSSVSTSPPSSSTDKPTVKKKDKHRTRDPSTGLTYLSSWKHRSSDGNLWKFNKNTQTWLIRNAYNCDVINKRTFTLLVEYIKGLKGDALRKRVEDDAVKRAFRYKNWEKNQTEDDGKSNTDQHDAKINNNSGVVATEDDIIDNDEKIWEELNAHDKRNEYKRARKIIDALKCEQGTSEP